MTSAFSTTTDGADVASSASLPQPASPALRLFALVLKLLGLSLWGVYLLYLPRPQWFQSEAALKLAGLIEPGMIFYSLATAGAAFFVWGSLMAVTSAGQGISRRQLLRASALGMLMLALMRLGTTLFPHGPFQQLLALPIAEFVVFTLIALLLLRASRT
ncbi:MAG: hypothetical protein VYA55_21435 [Pseudomonadota bacterium]|nr:hypothetical protein [Pseudomonadota bacterium]